MMHPSVAKPPPVGLCSKVKEIKCFDKRCSHGGRRKTQFQLIRSEMWEPSGSSREKVVLRGHTQEVDFGDLLHTISRICLLPVPT